MDKDKLAKLAYEIVLRSMQRPAIYRTTPNGWEMTNFTYEQTEGNRLAIHSAAIQILREVNESSIQKI